MRQFKHQFGYTRCQNSFYFWQIGPVIKHWQIPNYYYQVCLEISFLLSTLLMMIEVSRKSAHLFKERLVLSKNYQLTKLEALKF